MRESPSRTCAKITNHSVLDLAPPGSVEKRLNTGAYSSSFLLKDVVSMEGQLRYRLLPNVLPAIIKSAKTTTARIFRLANDFWCRSHSRQGLRGFEAYAIHTTMKKCWFSSSLPRAFWVVLPLILLVSGCGAPTSYWQPRFAASDTQLFLTVQIGVDRPGAENEREFLLLTRPVNTETPWTVHPRAFGKVADLLSFPNHVLFVMEDGTLIEHTGNDKTQKIYATKTPRIFKAATLVGEAPYAVETRDGNLQLFRFATTSGEWSKVGSLLRVIGEPYIVHLATWQGKPLVVWRTRRGGSREPGLKASLLTAKGWKSFPLSPTRTCRGAFSILNIKGRLLLLRDPILGTASGDSKGLLLDTFVAGKWQPYTDWVALPESSQYLHGQGVVLAAQGKTILLARADLSEVSIFTAPETGGGTWKISRALERESSGGFWSNIIMLIFFTTFLGLFFFQRRLLRKHARLNPKLPLVVIGLASPLDRALAFLLDGILLLPLPLTFQLASSNLDIYAMPESRRYLLFWVWLVGLIFYTAIAEVWQGRTIGKAVLGLHVRNVDGGRLRPRQAFLRNIARVLDFFPVPMVQMPYLVALLFIILTPKRQRLGDLIARTIVRRHVPLQKRVVILASASARRQQLLAALGVNFTVQAPDLDESIALGMQPTEAARRLARRKAAQIADALSGQELVIAADTIVVCDQDILGKPRDAEEARAMLRRLSNRSHKVITGVAIIDLSTGQLLNAHDETEVEMKELSEEEIAAYVASGESDGKSGAYAIQESGDRFVVAVRGSLSNVIGLPMELLQSMLRELDA